MDVDPRWYDGFFEGEWLEFLARAERELPDPVEYLLELLVVVASR